MLKGSQTHQTQLERLVDSSSNYSDNQSPVGVILYLGWLDKTSNMKTPSWALRNWRGRSVHQTMNQLVSYMFPAAVTHLAAF